MLRNFDRAGLTDIFYLKNTSNLLVNNNINDISFFNFLGGLFLSSSFHGEVINIFSVIYWVSTF